MRGEEGGPHRLLPPAHIPATQETHTGELEGTLRHLHRLMSSFPFHLLLSAAVADIPFAWIRVRPSSRICKCTNIKGGKGQCRGN